MESTARLRDDIAAAFAISLGDESVSDILEELASTKTVVFGACIVVSITAGNQIFEVLRTRTPQQTRDARF